MEPGVEESDIVSDQDLEGVPWYVKLYVDELADEGQLAALSNIFLGRAMD